MKNQLLLILSVIVLCYACGQVKTNKEPEKIVKHDTITKLNQLKENDTAVFKAPNGICYMVYGNLTKPADSAANKTFVEENENNGENDWCNGPSFDGSDRKAAKTSVAKGSVSEWENLNDVLTYLGTNTLKDDVFGNRITDEGVNSKRINEENRNIKIKRLWLYTFCRQKDEDYHLIVGSTNNIKTAKIFNVEISGLPDNKTTSDYKILEKARNEFYNFFGVSENDCFARGKYTEEYKNNPIEVSITGSLFFDKCHYKGHGAIGPKWARGTTYWEIHPITTIEFIRK
jgi:hypothetical protein